MEAMTRAAEAAAIPLDRWIQRGRAILDPTGQVAATLRTEAEARRFVAAINAVAGMSTDALEAWTTGVVNDPIQDLAAELAAMVEFVPHPNERRRAERRQNDRRRFTAQVRINGEP
jgi:hypothetical protein